MNKALIAVVVLALCGLASASTEPTSRAVRVPHRQILALGKPELIKGVNQIMRGDRQVRPDLDLCPFCVSFMGESLNELLNLILQGGVIGGCGALCGGLKSKLGATVCNLLCDYVGVTEFMKIVQSADPDPIYICERLRVCKVCKGAAKFNAINVTPPSGPQGTTFDIVAEYTVTKETCTGEVALQIQPPDGMPMGSTQLSVGMKPGTYGLKAQLKTQPSQQEPFSPGTYPVVFALCEGSCGSKHPNSTVLAEGSGKFEVTQ